MTIQDNDSQDEDFDALRERAEKVQSDEPPLPPEELAAEDAVKLIHELRTHQIELKLQNEELQSANAELDQVNVELTETRDRLADLYDFAPVGYMTLDEKGNVLEANLRLAEMAGRTRRELERRKFSDFLFADDQEAYFLTLRALVTKESPRREVDLRLCRGEDEPLWTRTNWVRVEAKESEPATLRVTLSDIREYKKMQAQLAQADRMASVGLLAAGIAHELNNPLAYVLYNIEALAEDLPGLERNISALHRQLGPSKPPESSDLYVDVREMIDQARSAAEGARRIRDILKRLKVFSHVQDDRVRPLELSRVLDSSIEIAHNELKYRAKVVTRFDDVPMITANDGHLCQVFVNLLVNAAQAIEEGDIEGNRVSVSLKREGDQVVASVEDTGPGIPPERLERIFDPFFTTKDVGVGSGLGLSICKKIVTDYGGGLTAESTPGKGSRFIVRLPISESQSAPKPSSAKSSVAEEGVRGRVLVIDDEPSIGRLLERALGQHEVTVVESGLDGRAAIEQNPSYEVILCDLMMPEFSGMDLYEWLATEHPELVDRVAFMTGAAFTPRAQKLLEDVSNIQLEKPFLVKNLQALVQKMILATRSGKES